MAFKVVLDANVLYPFSLRDTLLRLAERELYVLAWSERILDEVSRNLVDDGAPTPPQPCGSGRRCGRPSPRLSWTPTRSQQPNLR
jgi:PIN domain